MTKKMKQFFATQREQSTIRERLGLIRVMPGDQLTEAITTERTTLEQRFTAVETEFRTALDALEAEQTQNGGGGEHVERRALIERCEFGRYLSASLSQQALDGAEAELNAAVEAQPQHGGVAIPWPVLAGRHAPIEKRADTTTALPSSGNETVEQEYTARLFANSAMEFLLTRNVMLPAGSVSIPVISAGPTAEYFAASAEADAEAATVEFKTADPTRLQAAVVLRAADIQRSPGLIAAIQSDLAMATREAVDKKIITQLFADLTNATDATATVSYGNFVGTLAGGVDGKAANGLGQIRALVAPDTYRTASSKISTNGDLSAVDYAAARAGGIFVSSNMPAKSGSLQKGILCKTGAPGSVASVFFGSSELLNDPWTNSQKGERRLTLLSFHQVLTLRAGGFSEASFKLS